MDIKVNDKTVVVFDLDDTLYNELDYLKSAYKAIAKYLDSNNWISLYAKMFSLYRSQINVFDYLTSEYNTSLELLIDLYRNHQPNIHLFDNALETIKAIKNKKGIIGIITDGRSKTQRAKIKALGILNYIDEIIISEEVGTEKPTEKNFRLIEDCTKGNSFWYIADNLKKDFIAPNQLGWNSIGLLDNGKNIHSSNWKYHKESYLPKEFIFSFEELKIV